MALDVRSYERDEGIHTFRERVHALGECGHFGLKAGEARFGGGLHIRQLSERSYNENRGFVLAVHQLSLRPDLARLSCKQLVELPKIFGKLRLLAQDKLNRFFYLLAGHKQLAYYNGFWREREDL
jgi:hypothetical protein